MPSITFSKILEYSELLKILKFVLGSIDVPEKNLKNIKKSATSLFPSVYNKLRSRKMNSSGEFVVSSGSLGHKSNYTNQLYYCLAELYPFWCGEKKVVSNTLGLIIQYAVFASIILEYIKEEGKTFKLDKNFVRKYREGVYNFN